MNKKPALLDLKKWEMLFFAFCLIITACTATIASGGEMQILSEEMTKTITGLVAQKGEPHRTRIEQGVHQVAQFWQAADGSVDDFHKFCSTQFIVKPELLNQTFTRLENISEQIWGHFAELNRETKWHLEIDTGPILPIDYLVGEFSPEAHAIDDLFKTKIAFVILLNFPLNTLEDRLIKGQEWSREQWAQDRLVKQFIARIPSEEAHQINLAYLAADHYIAEYNIHMHQLLTEDGKRLFPEGLKLITHWGLRDELKSQYANPAGLVRQEMIMQVMERIVRQEIPLQVINNPEVDWVVGTNEVRDPASGAKLTAIPEGDCRFQHLLDVFHAVRATDKYYPGKLTMLQRRFDMDREIPEKKVEALFTTLLSSPVIKEIAQFIQQRVSRPLQPFDSWYDGFKSRGTMQAGYLDKIVSEKYPSVAAFQQDLDNILGKLGFQPETAKFLAGKIQVDPSRGAGHANEGGRRSDKAHLRTRIPAGGMQYKGYNIAIHEFGHNVEQVFSLNRIDHYLLRGVPNNAFTEAFAFMFQARDLQLLGIENKDENAAHLKVLDQIWGTYEIAGVALLDMAVWHWMYDNPTATAAQLRDAVVKLAIEGWNQYYAPVLGQKDSPLPAIYSHMIAYGLYLPDYPLGHIIDFQIEEYMKDKNLALEMERMCRLGAITPDQWMQEAVGAPISVEPMLVAAKKALAVVRK